ncbi:RHS repeat-associated core domain-containing protein [Streptomyces werraensis]|uniref:RHS repeat-associated core domain-containing protein n=1 Tax=Streptomyces werraensis TaxID=68284 RepID=UPI001CE25A67
MRPGLLARSRLLVVGALALALVGGTVNAQAAPPERIPEEVAAGIPQEPRQPEREKNKAKKQDKADGRSAAEVDGQPVTDDAVYAYDAAGRLVGVSDPDGETARYRYDAAGNRLGVDRYASSELSVLSVVPLRALPGARVTISGTGFSTTPASNTVTFGSVAATVVSATATKLVVEVPAGAANGRITVKVGARSVQSGESFTLAQAPTLSSVSPTAAPPATVVTLTGSGFAQAWTDNQVRFNGRLAEVTSRTATTLGVRVPEGATNGAIELITPDGKATGPAFTVLPRVPEVESSEVTAYTDTDPPLVWTSLPGNFAEVQFDGKAGDNVSFGFTSFTYKFSVPLELRGPSGAVVPGATGSVASQSTRWGVRNLPADGRYTLRLKPGTIYNPGETKVTVSSAVSVPALTTSSAPATGTIARVGQEIATTFTASAGDDYNLTLTDNTIGGSAYLTVVAPSGTTVASPMVAQGARYSLRLSDLPSTGTYKVFVTPREAVTGSVTMTLASDKVVALGVDAPASEVSVVRPGERLRFTFTAPASGELAFAVTGNTFTTSSQVRLVDSRGGEGLAQGSVPAGQSKVINLTGLQAGQPYALTLSPADAGVGKVTPWLSVPQAVTVSADQARTVQVTRPGQQLDLKVDVTANSGGSFLLSDVTFGASSVSVHAPAGDTRSYPGTQISTAAELDLRAPLAAGTYRIRVTPLNALTGQAVVTYRPDAAGGKLTVGGAQNTVTVANPGQNALYTFDGTAGQRLTLNVGASPGSWKLSVWGPDGWLNGLGTVPGGTTTSNLSSLPATGTYYLTAAPVSLATGTFKLGLTATPAAIVKDKAERKAPKAAAQRKPAVKRSVPVPRGEEPVGADTWRPTADNLKGIDWYTRKGAAPKAPPALRAPKGTTAISGHVLKLDGKPLAGVTVRADGGKTRTDARGRFLLTGISADTRTIVVDGATANTIKRTYGRYDIRVKPKAGKTTDLGFPVWMTPLDMAHTVRFSAPTTKEVVLTTPRIPGLEIRLPKGSVVRDENGKPVTELGITAIANDRPPFPMPQGKPFQIYFTVQPGGTYVFSKGAQVIYPNYTRQAPGTRVDFMAYDPEGKGWHVYGHGRVTKDGRQIVPDSKSRVWFFGASAIPFSDYDPPEEEVTDALDGDPIDLGTGKMVDFKTDLAVAGPLGDVEVTRSYWGGDSKKRAFGKGRDLSYNIYLHTKDPYKQYSEVDLWLPGGKKHHYVRTSPGTSNIDAVLEYTGSEAAFVGSKITFNAATLDWVLSFPDGSSWIIPQHAPLKEMRDRFGNVTKLIRLNDDKGPVVLIEAPGGRWIHLGYDGRERVRQVRDNTGRTVSYEYDDEDRLVKVIDPANKSTIYTYEGKTNCVEDIIDARGIRYLGNTCVNGRIMFQWLAGRGTIGLTYAWSGDERRTSVTRGDGSTRGAVIGLDGLTRKNTVNGRETTYEREPNGRLKAEVDHLGRRTEYGYDTKGNLTSVKELVGTPDERVLWTRTFGGPFNQLTKETDGLDHANTYEYDPVTGNLKKAIDAEGRETTFTYEPTGQVKTVTDPTGTTTNTYRHGDLVSVEDSAGRTSSQFTDAAGRVSVVTDQAGARFTVGYDRMNHLVSTTDPLGQTASYTYDANGNRTSATDVRNNTTTWVYDNADNLDYVVDPLNNQTDIDYDITALTRQVTVRSPEGDTATATYDTDWRIKTLTHRSGGVVESALTYSYNPKNLLEKITDGLTNVTESYTYDTSDRLKTITGPTGTVEYGHDKADRLTTVTAAGVTTTYGYDDSDILTSVTTGTETVSFGLDGIGRERTATMPGGIVRTTGYDDSGAVKSLTYTKDTSVIGDLTYTRDARGLQTHLTGSLAGVALPAATTADATFGKDNRITTFGGREFQYNKDGELTNDGLRNYTWNARGELTSLTQAGKTSTFGYTPGGDRFKKSVAGTERRFLTDLSNPMVEQNASGETTARVAASGVDEYLTRTEGGKTQVYLTDALGSVVGLANEDGTVATRYTYDPYGQSAQSGAATSNPYTFTGREDDGTGLMYYRARYYHSETGRFISQDPIGAAGGPNLYQYALSSPTTFTDPSGNIPTVVAGCLAGAAMDGAQEWGSQHLTGRKTNWGDVGMAALQGCVTGALGGPLLKALAKLKKAKAAKCLINSFTEDTPVLMADGTTKHIENIEIGDKVLATDPETGETGEREVTALIRGSGNKRLVDITVSSAEGKSGSFTATAGHPVWLPEENEWADAGALRPGQRVQTEVGTSAKVTKVRHHTEVITVYNLTVDNLHTYYVLAGETPVLVHNSNCGGRGLWQLTKERAAKLMKGGPFKTTFYKSRADGTWWTPDKTGHGQSAFKVYKETPGGLEWIKDADKYGNYMLDKWKGDTGRFIPWEKLHGANG